MRIGLDIDGVITADPGQFAGLTHCLLTTGGEAHIVTSRSIQSKRATETELASYAVQYSELFFLPDISQAQALCPHPRLNWYQKFLWHKVDYALKRALSHFVDDDAMVESLFGIYAPRVVFIRYPSSLAALVARTKD
jgi:hypothetical protein